MNTDYWCIEAGQGGNVFRVPAAVAKTIIAQLEDGIAEFIQFTDMSGSHCGYRATEIRGWYESTTSNREGDRQLTTAVQAEVPTVPGVGE